MSQKSDSSYNSSGCSTSESESNEETYAVSNLCEDFKKLKPYDYESLAPSSDESDSELKSSSRDSWKGNKSWCKCAQCKAMQMEQESWCCQDANEIAENLF